MAKFFIDRPVFAMVIAIVTVILGLVAIPNLPVATYPEVVPPVVQITAVYRGGNSQDLEKTVAQPIEHRCRSIDADKANPCPRQRQGDTARSASELENRSMRLERDAAPEGHVPTAERSRIFPIVERRVLVPTLPTFARHAYES